MREQVVELVAADDRPQARHGDALAGEAEVVHAEHGLDRVDHLEVDHGVDLDGDVVLGDHRLRRDVHHLDPQRHLDQPVDDREPEDHPGSLGLGPDVAEAEEHRPLVLGHHPDRRPTGR